MATCATTCVRMHSVVHTVVHLTCTCSTPAYVPASNSPLLHESRKHTNVRCNTCIILHSHRGFGLSFVVRKILLRVQYKQILLLAPSRWLRTTHVTHLPTPRWEGLHRSRQARFALHLAPKRGAYNQACRTPNVWLVSMCELVRCCMWL